MPYYTSAGLRLHYEEHGQGKPLILLHGFGQDGSAWIDPLPQYARFFRVLVMDMRGCGRSEVPEPGYTARDLADDVIALMDHLELEKAHFSGFSLGGAAGLELGINFSPRLSSLSLHSTWEGGRVPNMERWVEIRRRIIAANDPVVNVGTRVVSFFSAEFTNRRPDRVDEFIARANRNPYPMTPKGIDGHAQACQTHDVRGRLDRIAVPTLITSGTMDRAALPSQARYLHEHINGSELIFFDDGGHCTSFQCPDEFVTVSLGFLLKN